MNLATPTFKLFALQGESRGVYMMADLKNINAQDFNICWTTC